MAGNEKLETKLAEIITDITFIPTPEQRRVKAVLWTALTDNPAHDTARITRDLAVQLTGDSRVGRWWDKEAGFRDWLQNKDEFRQRVEYLTQMALDTLEGVLASQDAKTASARVNAAKLLLEVANKMPQKYQKEIYHDERIQKMSANELREYISRQTKLVALPSEKLPGEEG